METFEYLTNKFDSKVQDGKTGLFGINRTAMALALGELGFNLGAEVGVAEGFHAKVLCDSNKNLRLHLIDIWETYKGYEEYENTDKMFLDAVNRLSDKNVVFHKQFSMDAVNKFEDNSLDFVYIDCAHDFKNVAMDISEWSKKVKIGGIVFGHDYKSHPPYMDKGVYRHAVHVKDVVDAFVAAKGIRKFLVLNNDIKDPTFGRDNAGWMFVRSQTDKL